MAEPGVALGSSEEEASVIKVFLHQETALHGWTKVHLP